MADPAFTRSRLKPPNLRAAIFAMGLGLLSAGPGRAQVQVQTLAAPDLFSVGAGTSDLPPDLWQGSSAALLRTAIPQLAARPLSPAAAGLARHLLAAPGNAPEGAGDDPALAGARAEALLQLGDAAGAETIAAGTPALAQKPELSRVAAEAALRTCGPVTELRRKKLAQSAAAVSLPAPPP